MHVHRTHCWQHLATNLQRPWNQLSDEKFKHSSQQLNSSLRFLPPTQGCWRVYCLLVSSARNNPTHWSLRGFAGLWEWTLIEEVVIHTGSIAGVVGLCSCTCGIRGNTATAVRPSIVSSCARTKHAWSLHCWILDANISSCSAASFNHECPLIPLPRGQDGGWSEIHFH